MTQKRFHCIAQEDARERYLSVHLMVGRLDLMEVVQLGEQGWNPQSIGSNGAHDLSGSRSSGGLRTLTILVPCAAVIMPTTPATVVPPTAVAMPQIPVTAWIRQLVPKTLAVSGAAPGKLSPTSSSGGSARDLTAWYYREQLKYL